MLRFEDSFGEKNIFDYYCKFFFLLLKQKTNK